jgi:transposase-like protein
MAKKQKRRSYDDKFRTGAVVTLQAAGYPNTPGALTRIANELGVPPRTLSRWFNGENNPPPDNLVSEKKEDMADLFETVALKYLRHAGNDDVVEGSSGRDAMMNAAVAVDKMRLLRGLPTEIVELMPGVVEALKKQNLDPAEVFRRMIERAANVSSQD